MTFTKTTAVYFSPTETSKKGAEAIAKAMSADGTCAQIDFTRLGQVPSLVDFGPDELVVFGAPVYGGRLFAPAAARFTAFYGNNTPCIITATYGNRHYDDTLLEMYDCAKAHGFIPIAAAALIGEHTYGAIAVGRPNAADIAEDTAFANTLKERLQNIDLTAVTLEVPGNRPYKEGGKKGGFVPNTLDSCINCGKCAKRCTAGAINPANVREINQNLCISCFRCVKACPVGAKVCDTAEYAAAAAKYTAMLAARRENEYFYPSV